MAYIYMIKDAGVDEIFLEGGLHVKEKKNSCRRHIVKKQKVFQNVRGFSDISLVLFDWLGGAERE